MNSKMMREKIVWPYNDSAREILLHCCCAVCTGEILEALLASEITPTVFFYNPNISQPEEYARRKADVIHFANLNGVRVFDSDYDPGAWLSSVKGLEREPEGGKRCQHCFLERLKASAQCAHANGLRVFTSTLGISRYKNFALVNACGKAAAANIPGLTYWDHNWRKKGGSERMYHIARAQDFYAQDYCGCTFSRKART